MATRPSDSVFIGVDFGTAPPETKQRFEPETHPAMVELAMTLHRLGDDIVQHRIETDPMPRTNQHRAAEGQFLCDLMERMTGVDELEDQIADAITQLMHLARWIDVDFDACMTTAKINFDAEVDEEEG
ncbi:hypothetical protein [Maritimibacter sp. DP1N21-5]|uniref:hypothetical protein n=1 Tax=Maritimibacter sp. DP1N21-5 TaxID=2836867 RepID=UPI001C47BD86|nr:hypothetical protein [Maritimibacter sp. DP1N21-5]MBV7408750.1 hypothetical protein [Maritimibacter sp. DP1N21-5]